MKTLDYFEWRDTMAKDLAPNKKIECPDCYGTGEAECDCCGAYSECETCEGKAKVFAGDVSEKQIRDSLTRGQYIESLKKDLTDLAAYENKDRIAVLTNHGLRVYSLLESKTEIVELR